MRSIVPTPAHTGPDTSQSGRTQKAGPSTSAAVVLRRAFQQASATPGLELDVVAAAYSASVLEAAFGRISVSERTANVAETCPGVAAGCAVTVTVAAVGPGVAAGSGADPDFEFVLAEEVPLPGHLRLGSTHKAAAGRRAAHNQVIAVREHATQRPGTYTAFVRRAGAVVHRLSSSNISGQRQKEINGHYIRCDVRGSLPSFC